MKDINDKSTKSTKSTTKGHSAFPSSVDCYVPEITVYEGFVSPLEMLIRNSTSVTTLYLK